MRKEKHEFQKINEAPQFMVYKKKEDIKNEEKLDAKIEDIISKLPPDVQERYKRALYIAELIHDYD